MRVRAAGGLAPAFLATRPPHQIAPAERVRIKPVAAPRRAC